MMEGTEVIGYQQSKMKESRWRSQWKYSRAGKAAVIKVDVVFAFTCWILSGQQLLGTLWRTAVARASNFRHCAATNRGRFCHTIWHEEKGSVDPAC